MKKPLRVADGYRTHPWSSEPGGQTVVVEFIDGNTLEYDKVKNTEAYIRKIKQNLNVKDAWVKSS